MKDLPPAVEHLRKLAQNYRDKHLALQKRYQEMSSADNFLMELRQREAALLDRFRQIQQQLLGSLQEKDLDNMLQLSRIFDEMRIISLFAIQTLRDAERSPASRPEQQ